MESYPIYRATHGGRDDYCGSVRAADPVDALTIFADSMLVLRGYSVDQSDGRVWLCPAMSRHFYYTYVEAVA